MGIWAVLVDFRGIYNFDAANPVKYAQHIEIGALAGPETVPVGPATVLVCDLQVKSRQEFNYCSGKNN